MDVSYGFSVFTNESFWRDILNNSFEHFFRVRFNFAVESVLIKWANKLLLSKICKYDSFINLFMYTSTLAHCAIWKYKVIWLNILYAIFMLFDL